MSIKTDFENGFMPKERAIKFINDFQNLDFENIEFETLKKLTIRYFPYIPILPVTVPFGELLYRARTIPYNQYPYENLCDFTPPAKKYQKNEFGRANKPFQTVFYCSTNMKVAAMEVCKDYKNIINPKFEVGWVVIGVWKVIDYCGLLLSSLYNSDQVLNVREDIKSELILFQNKLNNTSDNKQSLPENTIAVTELLMKFFSDEFSKNNVINHNDYKISTAYTDRIFSLPDNIFDGIRYPSVPMKYQGDNIVLSKSAYQNKLELVKTLFITCGLDFEIDDHIVTGILLEDEKIEGDKIVWKKETYKHDPEKNRSIMKEIDLKKLSKTFNDISKMDDRHSFKACIFLLKEILEKMAISFLVDHISQEDPILFNEINPKKNFSFSIRLGYHLGLLSEIEYGDLQIIKIIDDLYEDNPFDFQYDNENIEKQCLRLQIIKSKKPPEGMIVERKSREYFKINVTFLATLLNYKIEKIEHLINYDFKK
jgi:hypothetical protein